MSFREFNQKYLEPGSMALMIFGIVCLCQPWIGFLHAYSVIMMLAGLIAFNVAVHVKQPEPKVEEDDAGPVSVSHTVEGGRGHG